MYTIFYDLVHFFSVYFDNGLFEVLVFHSGVPLLSSVCVPQESSAAESPGVGLGGAGGVVCPRQAGHRLAPPPLRYILPQRVHSSWGSPRKKTFY